MEKGVLHELFITYAPYTLVWWLVELCLSHCSTIKCKIWLLVFNKLGCQSGCVRYVQLIINWTLCSEIWVTFWRRFLQDTSVGKGQTTFSCNKNILSQPIKSIWTMERKLKRVPLCFRCVYLQMRWLLRGRPGFVFWSEALVPWIPSLCPWWQSRHQRPWKVSLGRRTFLALFPLFPAPPRNTSINTNKLFPCFSTTKNPH